ncbi:toxic anion resistance protein [Geminicoccus roseus]|uniref:toxic anion resistance protein n=1 Tax=Geminicoccus roseus TaxID=404900 RepID=UPI000424BA16|nr:toxic anion resistance protein [Geminicoccus roseus]
MNEQTRTSSPSLQPWNQPAAPTPAREAQPVDAKPQPLEAVPQPIGAAPPPVRQTASTSAGLTATSAEIAQSSELAPEQLAEVEQLLAEIDLGDSNSVVLFGARAQGELTNISEQMLEGVRNKDAGPAGDALSRMLLTLKGFDTGDLKEGRKPSWLSRLFGATEPIHKFVQKYQEVRGQIETIGDSLNKHKNTLMIDVEKLDRLYEATLSYFHQLALYIAAGEEMLRKLDHEQIPALARAAEETGEVLTAQRLRDLRAARDDLERRVHDLKLTRQVTMQALPSIRLVQENDKGLINKITSTLANTIPLWKTQLAQAITIYRSSEAAKTLKEATDLTNQLLEANAKNLKDANAMVREQIERGVFDISVVERANRALIDTIQDSLRIADEGKVKRADAEKRLVTCETELKQVLRAASAARGAPAPGRPGGRV